MRFQFLKAANIKMPVFRDIVPCILVYIDRRFRATCFLHYQAIDLNGTRSAGTVFRQVLRLFPVSINPPLYIIMKGMTVTGPISQRQSHPIAVVTKWLSM
jgi:hypothetical protein